MARMAFLATVTLTSVADSLEMETEKNGHTHTSEDCRLHVELTAVRP